MPEFIQFYSQCNLVIASCFVVLRIRIIECKLFDVYANARGNSGKTFFLSYSQFLPAHVVITESQTHRFSRLYFRADREVAENIIDDLRALVFLFLRTEQYRLLLLPAGILNPIPGDREQ